MSFDVVIIRNRDQARVTYVDGGNWTAGAQFRWTEGNEACDCNRRGYFLRAQGDPDPDYGECGHTDFSVILPTEPPAADE